MQFKKVSSLADPGLSLQQLMKGPISILLQKSTYLGPMAYFFSVEVHVYYSNLLERKLKIY